MNKKATLVLVRHGEATCNTLGEDEEMSCFEEAAPLTARGWSQARDFAADFPNLFCPFQLYVSPLQRALETARPLAQRFGAQMVVDERLAELKAPSWFEPPVTVRRWDELLEARIHDPDRQVYPGLESVRSQHQRIVSFLEQRWSRAEGNVVVVSHALTIELALLWILQCDLGLLRRVRFKVSKTGCFIARREADRTVRLVVANSKAHLSLREDIGDPCLPSQ